MLDKIIEKLKTHMINSMGFTEEDDVLSKKLTVDEYYLSGRVVESIMNGEAYKGMDPYDTIQSILVDNYIGENIYIENHVIDKHSKLIHCSELVGASEKPGYIRRGDTL